MVCARIAAGRWRNTLAKSIRNPTKKEIRHPAEPDALALGGERDLDGGGSRGVVPLEVRV